jgi:hypothetical protein
MGTDFALYCVGTVFLLFGEMEKFGISHPEKLKLCNTHKKKNNFYH